MIITCVSDLTELHLDYVLSDIEPLFYFKKKYPVYKLEVTVKEAVAIMKDPLWDKWHQLRIPECMENREIGMIELFVITVKEN